MLKIYWARFKKNPLCLTGLVIMAGLLMVALFCPWLAPYDPMKQNLVERLAPPSSLHWMGTDELGRDVLSRILYGTRISLGIGFIISVIVISFGTIYGLISGYVGKSVDYLMMRFVDLMFCFPTLYLILMILAIVDKPNIFILATVISVTAWPGLARMVRGEVLSVRERDFILVAQGLGLSQSRIVFLHLLPNVISPVLVAATFMVGSAILMESALSFLGLGVQPPNPSWGNILTSGKDFIHIAWWLSVFPGLAILATVLGFNFLGEGLRDVLDPRL